MQFWSKRGAAILEKCSLTLSFQFEIIYIIYECSICLQEINESHGVETTPCTHKYHKNCLTGWTEEHSTCPICRAKLPTLKCLKNAIISRNYSEIQHIIDQKRELIDTFGRNDKLTPLMFTVSLEKNEEMVQFLIDQNANVRYQNEDGFTALMIAAFNGDVNIVEKIILKDATTLDQVNYKNGYTVLMAAVGHENEEMVQFLIDQNANLKYQSKNGYTALMIAAQNGSVNIAKLIILKDATTLDQENIYINFTLLMIAVKCGRENIVQFLIDLNANVRYRNEDGVTALMIAVLCGYVDIAEKIILKDATTIDQVDNKNFTPLMFAVVRENEEMVQFLIDQNANLNYKNENGYTALAIAAKNSAVNIAKLIILKDGTTLDQVDNGNFTPLMIAVDFEREEMVQFLIDQNANVKYQPNEGGDTALMLAVGRGKVKIAEKIILKDATTVHERYTSHITPLMLAVFLEKEEMIQLLIDQNTNLKCQNENGFTALMLAVHNGNENIAKKIILKDKSTLDQVDNENLTALMMAVNKENEEMVQLLIDQHANLKYPLEDVYTPLMIATEFGYVNIAKKLIHHDTNLLNEVNKNKNLLEIAKMRQDEDMITLLKTLQMQ